MCCRAAARCNQATKPFPEENIPDVFSPENTRGKDIQFHTEVRTTLKNQNGHVPKKQTQEASFTHKKEETSAHADRTLTSRGAQRLSHSSTEHAVTSQGAISQSWGGGRGSALSQKRETHAVEKNTRTHTHTYTHTDTCPRSIECIYHIESNRATGPVKEASLGSAEA